MACDTDFLATMQREIERLRAENEVLRRKLEQYEPTSPRNKCFKGYDGCNCENEYNEDYHRRFSDDDEYDYQG